MSVTFPKGFRAAGVAAGLKATGGKDVALVVNDAAPAQASAAAVFTVNRFAAAPVLLCQQTMAGAAASGAWPRAVILNSGGANAATGAGGLEDALSTAVATASQLDIAPGEVLVCSTGLIGERLNMPKLLAGVTASVGALDPAGGPAAAEAIMTTDTKPKEAIREAPEGYRLGGMAKGAGMLAPELATMLVVVTTDALIDPTTAQNALNRACGLTFDRIDSDGCMSTNDTVILLASGASGVTPDPASFTELLGEVTMDLARQLIEDAEGAHHSIEITVKGALTEDGALAVARAIARSNLFKTAIAGNDPNWGRILSAAGTVPAAVAPFDPDQVDVSVNGVMVCRAGGLGEPRDLVDLTDREAQVTVDLHAGTSQATVWTNDLTHEYVSINADYSS